MSRSRAAWRWLTGRTWRCRWCAQCELLGVARSTLYYGRSRSARRSWTLMRRMDEQYLANAVLWLTPDGGVRCGGRGIGRRTASGSRRLMRADGDRGDLPEAEHQPQAIRITRCIRTCCVAWRSTGPNQVWCADITYIPMAKGFVYLVAVMDWFSRRVLAWRVSISLDATFCIEALREALDRHGQPDIFNTDQGVQFTSADFLAELEAVVFGSAWTARGAISTTSSSSGCGGA